MSTPSPQPATAGHKDVFDALLDLLSPTNLLQDSRATGDGVKVCLLDSGVERDYLEREYQRTGIPLREIEGGIFTAERPEPLPYEGKQSAPHGTTVADIILKQAPGVKLYSADIFGPRGSCDVEVVVRAIRWAMDVWDCKILNLSLGVSEQRLQQIPRRQQLLRAVEEAYFRDVLIVAAAHNEHPLTRSYPAHYSPPILSVDKHIFSDPLEFAYRLSEHIEFQAHSKGYVGPFAQEPATSWAAPHLTGIAARLLSLRPELKPFEIKSILYWMFQSAQRRETPIT